MNDSANEHKEEEVSPTRNVHESSPNGSGLAEGDFDNKSLGQAKNQRRQVEQDAQLLANRIALLRQEEARTRKKIEETKKRVDDIMDTKKKNEERLKRKQEFKANQARGVAQNKEAITRIRQQRQQGRENAKNAIQAAKREDFNHLKAQRRDNEARKKEHLHRVQQENAIKGKIIRDQTKIGQQRIKQHQMAKQENFRKSYENRIAEEELMKAQKEKEVAEMEILEMELIKQLQNTQMIQKSAYEDLENALQAKSFNQAKDMIDNKPE